MQRNGCVRIGRTGHATIISFRRLFEKNADILYSQDMNELQSQFRKDGVVFIQGALDRATLKLAEAAFDWTFNNPGPGAGTFSSVPQARSIRTRRTRSVSMPTVSSYKTLASRIS